MKGLTRLIRLLAMLSAVAAVVQQLRRPKEQRTWTGHVAGFIPYDFRPPTLERLRQRWWNPNNPSLFGPHMFGVGWSINLYQVWRRLSALAGGQ